MYSSPSSTCYTWLTLEAVHCPAVYSAIEQPHLHSQHTSIQALHAHAQLRTLQQQVSEHNYNNEINLSTKPSLYTCTQKQARHNTITHTSIRPPCFQHASACLATLNKRIMSILTNTIWNKHMQHALLTPYKHHRHAHAIFSQEKARAQKHTTPYPTDTCCSRRTFAINRQQLLPNLVKIT